MLEVVFGWPYEKDLGSMQDAHERMGVREWCMFDPKGDMHRPDPQLLGHAGRVYKRASCQGDPSGPLAAMGEHTGLGLRIEDDRMGLSDPAAQEYLLDQPADRARHEEKRDKCIAAEQRARDLASEMAAIRERRREQPQSSAGDSARVALQQLGTRRTPKGLRLLWPPRP